MEQEEKQNGDEEDSYDQSQSVSMSIAPKFKIKKAQESHHQPIIQEMADDNEGRGVTNYADLQI